MTFKLPKNIAIQARADFLRGVSSSTPIAAVSELIWNGLDAGASRVKVTFQENKLGALHAIIVEDDGDGIDASKLDEFFGNLGNSWKSSKRRYKGRSLHGKNGKGRFKAFSLGEHVEWNTTYADSEKTLHSYKISGRANDLTNFVPLESAESRQATGTLVRVENLASSFPSLVGDNAVLEITRQFAVYLTEYPEVRLTYDGQVIDPRTVEERREDFHLGDVILDSGKSVPVVITLIEWKSQIERAFQLCDSSGVSLHTIPVGNQIRAPGYSFTIYVKSDHFRELDKKELLTLHELQPDVRKLLDVAKDKVREQFRIRQLQFKRDAVQRWKDAHIYPFDEKRELNSAEQIERQVFDIVAISVEDHLPSFDNASIQSKKFTFRLLAQALRDNPESLQLILDEVLSLKTDEQNDLATLLRKTSLSRIITAAKIVADRLNLVEALNDLLFSPGSKKTLLERDQLHKVLEKEAWIFDENFNLAGSEKSLNDALSIHRRILRDDSDSDSDSIPDGETNLVTGNCSPVLREGDRTGRIDLLLSRSIKPTQTTRHHLVVELKRPSQRINSEILTQIKSYAHAVSSDNRFDQSRTRWTFMVIGNEFDPFAMRDARQRDRPEGLIYDDEKGNVTVWAKTWSEVLSDARARLQFFSEQLEFEADNQSELDYLRRAHAKFIPEDIAISATNNLES